MSNGLDGGKTKYLSSYVGGCRNVGLLTKHGNVGGFVPVDYTSKQDRNLNSYSYFHPKNQSSCENPSMIN
jgi:hypothetical protein